MKANRSGLLLSSRNHTALTQRLRRWAFVSSAAAIAYGNGLNLPSAQAQTSNFATTQRTVTLPQGTQIDPRFLLRRQKPASAKPAQDETDPQKAAEQKLADELDGKLLGAWVRATALTQGLTAPALKAAASRCYQQLKLKPLRFETTAAQKLPDIGGLFGDVVYYRTDKGLQRLDIPTGLIRHIQKVEVQNLGAAKKVWKLTGTRLLLRIRFSKPLPQAPKTRFMIEESGFFLRCPSDKDDIFNVNQ